MQVHVLYINCWKLKDKNVDCHNFIYPLLLPFCATFLFQNLSWQGLTASSDQSKTSILPISDDVFSDSKRLHHFELKTFLLTKRDIKSQFVFLAPSELMNII